MALNRPNQLTTAFANAGLKNDIPQSATGSNLASYEEGFPVITMQAIADGGMPPQGQDFNGMFYTLTDIARYAQAGGLYPFDKEFCTAIGGYPLGAILTSLDGAKLYINQVNGNTNNPDTNSTNWQTILTSTLLDAVPTADSTNPVASNGVFDALATKQNTLTFDNAPTSGSINPVTSGGIKTALDAKQDTLTFDSTPTADSNNPVTSQGIKAAIDAKDSLPSQTGHAGEYLKTDGETASWSNVESLPSQTGNAGKILGTDGTSASWVESSSIPSGIITMWSGSANTIPTGWVLCDGENNTPDLRNRFIVGAGSTYAVGATGGSASGVTGAASGNTGAAEGNTGDTTLSLSQIPSHKHLFSYNSYGSSGNYRKFSSESKNNHNNDNIFTEGAGGGGSHTHTLGKHTHTLGNHTHTQELPPYYALCYIMKI